MKKQLFIILFLLFIVSFVNITDAKDNKNNEYKNIVAEYQKVKSTDFSPAIVAPEVQSFINNPDNTIKVIVVLKEDGVESYAKGDRKKRKQAIKMFTKKITKDLLSVKIIKQFQYTSTLYVETDEFGLNELRNHPDVEGVYEDMVMTTNIVDSIPHIEVDDVWAEQVGGTYIKGASQSVCVVGSGIKYNHTGLGGAWGEVIIDGYDIMDSDADPYADVSDHETGVAGIVASQGTLYYSDYKGVAPESKIIAMRVSNGTGTWADALTAFEWCIDNASLYNISVISYSSGTGTTIYDLASCQANGLYNSWRNVVLEAHNNDIMVVNSAGNTVGGGVNKTGLGVQFPACIPEVIAVGGVADDDTVDYYTHAGEGLDFLAPDWIKTTGLGIGSVEEYHNVQGSSFSAPHVSGTIALLNQYSMLSKGYLVDYSHVIDIINKSGVSLYDQWADANYTRINASGVIDTFVTDSYPVYSEFTMNTTNFSALTLGDLDNVTTPILENEYARIDWSGADFNVDFKDMDSAVELTNNSVMVNSNNLPSFNITANITMHDVSYDSLIDYRILKDGILCDDCTKISYSPVKFSVTGFSTYTTEFINSTNGGFIIAGGTFTLKNNNRLILKV